MRELLTFLDMGFESEEFEMIIHGFENGLTVPQVAAYARPGLCAAQMEVLYGGIKEDSLSFEQIDFMIDSGVDWMTMHEQRIAFNLGISIEEMKDIFKFDDYNERLNTRIDILLKEFVDKNMPAANKIISAYKKDVEGLSSKAGQLLKDFYSKYINSGYEYSGSIRKTDILDAGYSEDVLIELLGRGIISRRNCDAVSFELSVLERYKLIKEKDLLSVWDEKGGNRFRLNNGYYGEFHRILRSVLKSQETKEAEIDHSVTGFNRLKELNQKNTEDFDESFGEIICESMNETDNSSSDIGYFLFDLLEKNKDDMAALKLIDHTVTAIVGYGLDTLAGRLETVLLDKETPSLETILESTKQDMKESALQKEKVSGNEKSVSHFSL